MQKGKVEILVNDQGEYSHRGPQACAAAILTLETLSGNRITPSYVAFTETERLIGDAAKNQAAANPTNTIYDVKYV